MIVSAKVATVGLDEALTKLLKDIEGGVDKGLDKIAVNIRDEAKASSHFADKTGRLRRSVKKEKTQDGYVVKATAPHAHLVEFGHGLVAWGHPTGKRVPPHPFMRKAVEQGISGAPAILRREVK